MNVEEIDSVIEHLRCATCKRYLMWPPIMQKPHGDNICGRCALKDTNEVFIRQMTLEEILRKLSFPCKNESHGCKRRLHFGKVDRHEMRCVYNSTVCPAMDCAVSDLLINLPQHLSEHAEIMKAQLKIDIEIARDYKEMIGATINGVTYMMQYEYNAAEKMLCFDIRGLCYKKAKYYLSLRNTAFPNSCVSIRGGTVPPYFQIRPRVNLCITKYLPALEDSNVVTFAFVIKSRQVNKHTQTDPLIPPPLIVRRRLRVDIMLMHFHRNAN
ncbi:hypothetical protein ILUMI_06197 [Ignelater luminosus]|uniref:SIAH-type domain-containing protein n=1 Tax=Ignelater luminosus TaxID=2038154 RepID=A0A8K0D8Z4_IGNLU|nr:hypothetical protein ILUMI_06197 [Ignelater luminosus]